jgi:hypothetical protein
MLRTEQSLATLYTAGRQIALADLQDLEGQTL